MGSDMAHSFTCKLHHACLYSPAEEHHRPLAGTHFTVPRRVEGWVDLRDWLHTETKCCLWESNSDTVTHPSTNRAQRRLTSLIETNDVTTTPLRHTTIEQRLMTIPTKSELQWGMVASQTHSLFTGTTCWDESTDVWRFNVLLTKCRR